MNDMDHRLSGHLDEMTCLLYVEGQLDRARAQEVSEHATHCAGCRTLLRALERESRLLTRAMFEDEEPLPARLAVVPGRSRASHQWIWLTVFGLAATGVYALYTGYIEPGMQRLEQAGFGGTNLLGLLIFQGAFWKGWQSMLTLFEMLALLTLAGFVIAFLRRKLRRGSAVALVLAGFCALLALPPVAPASEFRHEEFAEVKAGETIKGDIFLFAHRARVDGTVEGDVFIFSGDANVSGHVRGDVISFAQSLRVSGQVDGNIRSFANNMTISGSVAKNVLTFDEVVNLDSPGKIGGSLTLFAQTLSLDGRLGRDLLSFAKNVNISGTVGGAIRARGGTLSIGSTAEVHGPIHFAGDKPPDVASEAKLSSPVEYEKVEHKPNYANPHFYLWRVIFAATVLLFGMVLFLLMPKFAAESVVAGERMGTALGLGVLVLFAVPIAAIVACVTVIGLALGISAILLWYVSLHGALLVVGTLLGKWILGPARDIWPLIGRMTLGYVLLRIIFTVPYLGGWAKLAAVIWGLGAISLALYQRFQPAPPVAPAAAIAGGAQPA